MTASTHRCKQLEQLMKTRQAGGAKTFGRCKAHDTSRLRCLTTVIYPNLKLGILPSALYRKILFELPGPNEIAGP